MATTVTFTVEEMKVDEGLGYPKAYAKLCRDITLYPYSHGPPFTFVPFALPPQEALRARELDQMFPIVNPEAKPSARPKIYANLLWKQLNHLGNAGFDPEKFRVDPYGNVLYYHADSASPLAWEIDHWFPCSRGGRTVASNLRILQRQVCKKKHNQLEFLVPWWDLQLGISVNQFLSVFASSNSDFRYRAFSLLFADGENEELNSSQTMESHAFPQHFHETKQKVGLAPAAIVLNRRESSDASSVLRSLDVNRRLRPNSPAHATRKFSVEDSEPLSKSIQTYRPLMSKENDNPCGDSNPHLAITLARDSLRRREEIQAEIQKLDEELDELTQKNDKERAALQDLELVLIKRRRRAEKCRRLAEAQSSYRSLLEKMIRDAMHQSVIYKEQVRLNQAAATALMARLEAQKAICDSSEKEVHRKFKQREEVEQQIRSCSEKARKRSRMDDTQFEERDEKLVLYLPGMIRPRKPLQKELRAFLEEEHKESEAGRCLIEEHEREDIEEEKMEPANIIVTETSEERKSSQSLAVDEEVQVEDKLGKLEIGEGSKISSIVDSSIFQSPEREEDEECRKQRGKGNVEKWLQMLLDDTKEGSSMGLPAHQDTKDDEKSRADDIIEKINLRYPQEEIRILKFPASEEKAGLKPACSKFEPPHVLKTEKEQKRKEPVVVEMDGNRNLCEKRNTSEVSILSKGVGGSKSFERKERKEKNGKERELVRCESARAFRPAPYSPSVILGMKKGVDCIGKKPIVTGSDEDIDDKEGHEARNNFFKSPFKTFKRAVKI